MPWFCYTNLLRTEKHKNENTRSIIRKYFIKFENQNIMENLRNPFTVGQPVAPENFVGRKSWQWCTSSDFCSQTPDSKRGLLMNITTSTGLPRKEMYVLLLNTEEEKSYQEQVKQ